MIEIINIKLLTLIYQIIFIKYETSRLIVMPAYIFIYKATNSLINFLYIEELRIRNIL